VKKKNITQFYEFDDVFLDRGYFKVEAINSYWLWKISDEIFFYVRTTPHALRGKLFIDGALINLKNILVKIEGVISPSAGMTINHKFEKFLNRETTIEPRKEHYGWRFQFANRVALNNFLDVCEAYAVGGMQAAELKASEFEQIATPKTSKSIVSESRVGQAKFRKDLLKYWKTCAVTNFKIERLLRASHIKPWSVATPTERLDSFNGLLLVPNLDALFDDGFISFDKQGQVLISSKLPETEYAALGLAIDMKLRKINGAHAPYLAYHFEYVFKP
jgi:hypothetical protein